MWEFQLLNKASNFKISPRACLWGNMLNNNNIDYFLTFYTIFETRRQEFWGKNSANILGVHHYPLKVVRHAVPQIQSSYSDHWPTLNIASPDLLSTIQNWHDGVIWDSTPPLIASDEGMVDRWSHAQKTEGGLAGRGQGGLGLNVGRDGWIWGVSVWGCSRVDDDCF